MGTDLLPGHSYTDGEFVNGPSLTEHVSEATIKPTFYSARTSKDPVVGTDEFLVRDTGADQYRKVTLTTLLKLMVGAGSVIQTSYAEYTANTNLTAIIPPDDTIPQNTEGTEILTASITPIFATSKILVTFCGMGGVTTASWVVAALFKDAGASALATNHTNVATNGGGANLCITLLDSADTLSAKTYRIRVGPISANTMRMNGYPTLRAFGGTMRTTLILQEIKQ